MIKRLFQWIGTRALKISGSNPRDPALVALFGSALTTAGVQIDETSALTFSAFWAGVRLLAETTGGFPVITYERVGKNKERARDHGVYWLLHDEPNTEQTPFIFKEVLQAHAVTWGNAYAEIERDNAGNPLGLWPITPNRVRLERDVQGRLIYLIGNPEGGQPAVVPARDMLHVSGFGFNGLSGYNVVQMARESIGLGLAAERFGSAFFGNSSQPGGFLKHPGALDEEALQRIRASWEASHRPLDKKFRVAVLEEGMEFVKTTVDPEQGQFDETRKLQVTEICRFLNIPAHMLKDMEHATFSNIEHQTLEFAIYTMRPWVIRFEQEYARKLLTPAERRAGMFVEHQMDALLRGDLLTRYQAYAIALLNGFKNIDEVRQLENMNPLPDGTGQIYRVPLNTIPAGTDPINTTGETNGD